MHRTEEHKKATELILRIINNIIKNPNNKKYKDISIIRILNKLNNNTECLDLLLNYGFEKCNNGNRLIFNSNKINELKELHELLLIKSHNNQIYSNNNITKNVMSIHIIIT